jgi:O-antigen/teichoic acid export membrane protein
VTPTLPREARRNLLVTLSGRAAALGLSFLATIWVIRYLGSERYGVYLLVFTVVTLVDLTLEASLLEIVVREIAKSKERAPEWLGAATLLRGVLGVALGTALVLVPLFVPLGDEAADTVRMGLLVFLINSFRTPVTYFRALLMVHWELGFWTVTRALELGLIVLVIQAAGGIAALMGAKAVAAAVFVVLIWLALLLRFRLPVHSGRALLRPLAALSIPLGLIVLLVLLQTKGDILLIGAILGPAAAGAYGAVALLPEFVITANNVLATTTGPLLARSLGRGETRHFQAVLQNIFDGLVAVLPGLAVVSCLLAEPLVRLGLGEEYAPVVAEFRILVWVGALIPVAGLLGITALTLNLQGLLVKAELVKVLLYVAGNALLLGVVGTIAAAWIRLLVAVIGPAWTYAVIRTHSPYRLSFRGLLPAGLSAGLSAVVTGATLAVHPLVAAAAGLATYTVALKTFQTVAGKRGLP